MYKSPRSDLIETMYEETSLFIDDKTIKVKLIRQTAKAASATDFKAL